jgi:hypothetical protein
MKLQDNAALLQWFHTYHQQASMANRGTKYPLSAKKYKVKAPEKIKLSVADKLPSKTDI